MKLRIAAVRRAVIVAPHPDDEVIGAAALIKALRQQGAEVRVVIASNGAASHAVSERWPRTRLIAARRKESLRALRRLSVLPDDVTFLDLPDGALTAHDVECRRRLQRVLARRRIDLLVGPAANDAHPDHRAVAHALRGCRSGARRLSYLVWPAGHAPRRLLRSAPMPGGAAAKASLIRLYRTQLGAITDDPAGFAIARHELALFAHPIEQFVAVRP